MILSAGKGGKTALVIGVQSADAVGGATVRKHAEKLGADAIVRFLRPGVSDEKAVLAYYQEVGKMTGLPLFAQAVGTMSVDLLVEMFKTIPTMRYVKDEAGIPLERIGSLREADRRPAESILGRGRRHDDRRTGARILRHVPLHRTGRRVRGLLSICGTRGKSAKRTTCSEGFRHSPPSRRPVHSTF